MRRLCALLLWAATASAQVASPLPPPVVTPATEQELVTLVRAQQLQHWLQQPVSLAVALCIQDRHRSSWPTTNDAPPTERQENALRLIHEACRAAAEDDAFATRLVTAGKAQFLAQMARLRAIAHALDSCRRSTAAPTAPVDNCVQSVAGRPLTERERRMLLAEQGTSSSPQ